MQVGTLVLPARSASGQHRGTSGVTFVAVQRTSSTVGVVENDGQNMTLGEDPAGGVGLDSSAVVLRLKGLSIFMCIMCLQQTTGVSGENVAKTAV